MEDPAKRSSVVWHYTRASDSLENTYLAAQFGDTAMD
jgi:hypothetical protein